MSDDRPEIDVNTNPPCGTEPGEEITCKIKDNAQTTSLPSPTLAPREQPKFIGDFRVARMIGAGGMGVVYEAEQQHPTRMVALKVIAGGQFVDEFRVKLFQREAQALARLKHPSIAAIYESGRTSEGEHFFAMELVRGSTLRAYLDGRSVQGGLKRSELELRLRLFRKICDGVAYAHQRGVVHRDLKPSNIQIPRESNIGSTPSGEPVPDVKILDFGLARITDADIAAATRVTKAGAIFGTYAYMSPEQVRGNPDEVDLRTDIYSLGVLLYEMVTGELPYRVSGKPLHEISRVICEEEPKAFVSGWKGPHRPDRDLETIVFKALEKSAARRYQSVIGLAEDIERYLAQEPILARPASTIYQLRKMVQRHRLGFLSATIILVLLAAGVFSITLQARAIARERDRANQQARTAYAATEFLIGLFEISDPGQARGETITAREVLTRGVDRIADELKDEPTVRARLTSVMGRVYLNLGLYDEAGEMFEQAFDLQSELLQDQAVLIAESINNIGAVNLRKGEYELAEQQFRNSLSMRRDIYGERSSEVAEGLNNLGTLLAQMYKLEEAETVLREALSIHRELTGGNDAETATMMNNLALYLERDGRHDEADGLNQEALTLRRELYGDVHPTIAQSLNNIGMIHFRRGQYDLAEPLFREALELNTKIYGEKHPEISTTLNNLALVLAQTGDMEQAEKTARQVVEADQELLGDAHPMVARSLANLAQLISGIGHFEEAEELFGRALVIEQTTYGEDSWPVATTESKLGECLTRQGKFSEAEVLLLPSHTILSAEFGDDHPRTAAVTRRVIDLYEAWEKPNRVEVWRAKLPEQPDPK